MCVGVLWGGTLAVYQSFSVTEFVFCELFLLSVRLLVGQAFTGVTEEGTDAAPGRMRSQLLPSRTPPALFIFIALLRR